MSQASHLSRRQQSQQQTFGCQIYRSPSANQVIEAYSTPTIEWDPHCIDSEQNIDVYLQSIDAAQPIHVWKNVVASSAKISSQFIPDWWNSTQSVSLQLVITPSDIPLWAGLGPGPIFFAHFNGTVPAGAPTPSNSHDGKQWGGPSIEYLTDLYHRSHHALSGGKLGVAIFLPLLAVAAAITAYIIISRRRNGQASKRWSEYVDKRMSVIGAQTWQDAGNEPPSLPSIRGIPGSRVASMYRHSASLPPRSSMAYSSNPRLSTFTFDPTTTARPPTISSHNRNTSFSSSAARVSFVDHPIGISSARPTSEVLRNAPIHKHSRINSSNSHLHSVYSNNPNTNRSASNLRFEVESGYNMRNTSQEHTAPETAHITPRIPPAASKPKSLKINTDVSVTSSMHGSDTHQSSISSTASGMRRLDADISVLSPDEALRQYTLFRERSSDSPSSQDNEAK